MNRTREQWIDYIYEYDDNLIQQLMEKEELCVLCEHCKTMISFREAYMDEKGLMFCDNDTCQLRGNFDLWGFLDDEG